MAFVFVSPSRPTKTGPGKVGEQHRAAAGLLGRLLLQPAQATIFWNSKNAALCMDPASWLPNIGKYWPLTYCWYHIILDSSPIRSRLSDLLVLSHRQHLKFLTHVQWRDCLSSQAAHAGHAHLPLLCRTRHGGCTNLAMSPIAFPPALSLPSLALLSSFTDQALSKHWVFSTSLWFLHLQHITACGIKH